MGILHIAPKKNISKMPGKFIVGLLLSLNLKMTTSLLLALLFHRPLFHGTRFLSGTQ
jgi:hypothetical protein